MSFRVFALIIGIDRYKSGNIWNLTSCEDDAQNMKRWLTQSLSVPRDHICLLLNEKATKQRIEDNFMSHLVNNPEIESGDAIIVYFAGHGSSVTAPTDWPISNTGEVDLLCTYDQDRRKSGTRIAGISDRSLHAMIDELSKAKGNNITVVVDSCFSPHSSGASFRDRQFTRWTPSQVSSDDLHSGLWRSAIAKTSASPGFFTNQYHSHTLLSACDRGGKAGEGKGGGRFTVAFLQATKALRLHEITYRELTRSLVEQMGEQRPQCLGYRKDSILFDQVPFVPHASYIPLAEAAADGMIRIEAGEMHGVVQGTEFSIHEHNFLGSPNPSLASFHASEVHHTWSLAKPMKRTHHMPDQGSWAKVSKWNNTNAPFKVHLQRTYTSVVSSLVHGKRPWKRCGSMSNDGLTLLQVDNTIEADITVQVHRRKVVVRRQSKQSVSKVQFPSTDGNSNVLDNASRFYHHLGRVNPLRPLKDEVHLELFRLDPGSWEPMGKNVLKDGSAKVSAESEAIYSVHIHNNSHTDLWVHLVYMDSNGYTVKMLYRPNDSTSSPPLKRHSRFVVGDGTPGSEAVKFSQQKGAVGYIKLFVSSDPTCLDFMEQPAPQRAEPTIRSHGNACPEELWDTAVAKVVTV